MNREEKRRLPVKITDVEFQSSPEGIQVLKLEFLKGDDKVVRYLMPDKIFEALAEYEETHLERNAKTGVYYNGYYNQGW